jgi:uncharacterized protein (DUF1501 family)
MSRSKPFSTPLTRREFLHHSGVRGLGLLSFSSYVPAFLARASAAQVPLAEKDRTILVLVQLAGGNDGLNTVIPFTNDHYHQLRPTLAIRQGLHTITDDLALHPSCSALQRLYGDGRLAIIQNVGYPNPNRSHFRSSEIWETATDSDHIASSGWIGRFFDNTCAGAPAASEEQGQLPRGIHVGDVVPQAFHARAQHNLFGLPRGGQALGGRGDARVDTAYRKLLSSPAANPQERFLQHTMLDVMVTEQRVMDAIRDHAGGVDYPSTGLARSLRQVAGLIAAGLETRVYFVSQGGYDTHANQAATHTRLLTELSEALAAFQKDLEAKRRADQVTTLTFSEFGRRADENAGAGTDHGAAAPLFVMGSAVNGGIYGPPPGLEEAAREVDFTTDFRSVYATVLDRWWQAPVEPILGQPFESMGFLG